MEIQVRTYEGNLIVVETESSSTVKSLKRKIIDKPGIPKVEWDLFFYGRLLEESKSLEDNKIHEYSTLQLEQVTRVLVICLDGREIPLAIKRSDTVDDVKTMMYNRRGIPQDQQRLIFGGKQLEDGLLAVDYLLKEPLSRGDWHKIHLVLRLIGGGNYISHSPIWKESSPSANQLEKQGMEIQVKTSTNHLITVQLEISSTVESLKTNINEKDGIPMVGWDLFFYGRRLEEGKTLEYYNIPEFSTLRLVQVVHVDVIYLDARKIPLVIQKSNTIDDMKTMLYNVLGLPQDKQCLIYTGKQLKDDCLAVDYLSSEPRDGDRHQMHLVERRGGNSISHRPIWKDSKSPTDEDNESVHNVSQPESPSNKYISDARANVDFSSSSFVLFSLFFFFSSFFLLSCVRCWLFWHS